MIFIVENTFKMNTLKEIKSGNTGYGLLVENDGYISMHEGKNQELLESYRLNENIDREFKCPYPFIVSAVFQKYGVKNANGRIYPEEVLKREVAKYQQAINERRAYGECYRPEALILTQNGWKQLKDVKKGEMILTLNTATNIIELKPILNIIQRDHNGKMYNITGRNINDIVTPEHGFPIYDRNNKFKGFYTAEDIYNNNVPDMHHSYIPKQGIWKGEYDEFMIIPAIDSEYIKKHIKRKDLKEKYSQDLIIPMEFFAKFMGIYLSEGSHSKTKSYKVTIHQKKEEVCQEIETMLSAWGIPFTINKSKRGDKAFVINDMRLHKYVSQFGIYYDKFVPYELKKQPKEILQIFYDWFVMGDGRIRGDKRRKSGNLSTDVFSTSKRMILDLNEIQLKIGYSGNYHKEDRQNDRIIENRLIKKENTQPLHFSYLSLTKGIYLDKRFLTINEINYEGPVMCVEVENHTWYVMDNNKCHWTKNCNHPLETSIDVGRICLNIIELHWEGKTLVGKMEIPITEAFRKTGAITCLADQVAHFLLSGLKLGVSSRGVGNVEEKYGTTIVTDYELICWDLVSQPSTPGAWIGQNEEELKPYMESIEKKNNLIIDNLQKFDTWLN